MLKSSWIAMVGLVAMLSTTAFGAFNTYTETFDADTGQWLNDGTGQNPAGWSNANGPDGLPGVMIGSRFEEFPAQVTARVANLPGRIENFLGDINAKYGDLIEASFWVKDLDGVEGPGDYPREIVFRPIPATGSWVISPTLMDTAPNGWQKFGVQLDTTWTNAEAVAAGWQNQGAAIVWADLMQNLSFFIIVAPTNGPIANSEGNLIDDIFIGGIPEPATLALLGLGGLMLIRRRH